MNRTRSQLHADKVFARVSQYVNDPANNDFLKKYKGLCKRSGGLLRAMGLIQFLVYLQGKGARRTERQHHELFGHLRECLGSEACPNMPHFTSDEDLVDWVRKQEVPSYMQATREVLALLVWFKQFVDVLIEGHADENTDGEEDG